MHKLQHKYLSLSLSALSGVFVAVMVMLNASLGSRIGVLESSFVVHAVGTIFALGLLLFFFRNDQLQKIKTTPKYLLASGMLGVLIVFVSNMTVPKLGMVLAIGLFLTGSLLFAVVADHFGFFRLPVYKISWRRALGLACAIAGLFMVL